MIRYIYTFFVGLFMAIFIGIGIEVFYPGPTPPEPPAFFNSVGSKELTLDQQKQEQEFNVKQKEYDKLLSHHNRYVSIIVLTCAVAILGVAMYLSERMSVIADGVLLGGIFTLLYGIGRGMSTDSNKYRFLVAAVGLAVTLVLGYLKFARPAAKPKAS